MTNEFIGKKENVAGIDLSIWNRPKIIAPQQEILNAHEFLKKFIDKFETAKRGGVHDFIEIALFNMITEAIHAIDVYLQPGHERVDASAVTTITVDAFQKVLDRIKRNLDDIHGVVLK